MIEFSSYEGTTAELEDLGTVKTVVGKGGKMAFIRKNWNNPAKKVAILLTNKAGKSAFVPCSTQVSNALRKKEITASQLLGLHILEGVIKDTDGTPRVDEKGDPIIGRFVSMPANGGLYEIAVDGVTTKEVELTAQSLEDLIAL